MKEPSVKQFSILVIAALSLSFLGYSDITVLQLIGNIAYFFLIAMFLYQFVSVSKSLLKSLFNRKKN